MCSKPKLFLLVLLAFFTFHNSGKAQNNSETKGRPAQNSDQTAIHKILLESPLIDGHNDLFAWYFGCSYKKLPKCPQDIADYPLNIISKGQTDIPRWRKGGVGGVLLNVYADSLSAFLDAYDLLYRIENTYKEDLKIVGSAKEMREAMKHGKIALLPMLEGSIRLENKKSLLRTFYKLGLRCVTFTYYTSDLADGSDDTPVHNGISALGKEMVKEMNNLGVIIDMSHISTEAMSQILDISNAPVIFSHSNARALCNVNRNVPDSILLRLKRNGGLIMLDMVPDHTSNEFAHWVNTGDSLYFSFEKQYPDDKQKWKQLITQWETENPQPAVSISEIADHFDYVKKLIGVDYIGIGGDYDGIDYTINGLEDVSCYPVLLTELLARGWSESELKKITGENFLRVFEAIELKAQK